MQRIKMPSWSKLWKDCNTTTPWKDVHGLSWVSWQEEAHCSSYSDKVSTKTQSTLSAFLMCSALTLSQITLVLFFHFFMLITDDVFHISRKMCEGRGTILIFPFIMNIISNCLNLHNHSYSTPVPQNCWSACTDLTWLVCRRLPDQSYLCKPQSSLCFQNPLSPESSCPHLPQVLRLLFSAFQIDDPLSMPFQFLVLCKSYSFSGLRWWDGAVVVKEGS